MLETHWSKMCQTLSPNSLPMAPHIPRIKATSPYIGPPGSTLICSLSISYTSTLPQLIPFSHTCFFTLHPISNTQSVLGTFHWKFSPVFCMAISLTSLKSLRKCHLLNSLTRGSLFKTAMLLLLHSPQFLLTFACYLQLMQCAAPPTGVNISPQSMENACHIGLNKYLLNVEWMKEFVWQLVKSQDTSTKSQKKKRMQSAERKTPAKIFFFFWMKEKERIPWSQISILKALWAWKKLLGKVWVGECYKGYAGCI